MVVCFQIKPIPRGMSEVGSIGSYRPNRIGRLCRVLALFPVCVGCAKGSPRRFRTRYARFSTVVWTPNLEDLGSRLIPLYGKWVQCVCVCL